MVDPRPAVSVCVPFCGSAEDAAELADALGVLELGPNDEIVIADNCVTPTFERGAGERPQMRVVRATGEQSSYHARNVAASAARNPWLAFTDADCRPRPDLLSAMLEPVPAEHVGAVVGAVHPVLDATTWVSRYTITRQQNKQAMHMRNAYKPFGATANLTVRREVWEAVGGFHEGIRSGGDCDFSWRLQDAGWELEYREEAAVLHEQRETIRQLVRQYARYGAGRRWIAVRHVGSRMRPRILRPVSRCVAACGYWMLRGKPRRAGYKLIDALVLCSEAAGGLLANTPPSKAAPSADAASGPTADLPSVCLVVDQFPEVSETFVAQEARELANLGIRVRLEAHGRGRTPARELSEGLDVHYLEDDGPLRKIADLAWLVTRAPLRCVADLRSRSRWREQEPVLPLRSLAPMARRIAGRGDEHLHAHFAAGAALTALRVADLLGRPWSFTAHGYDIFRTRRNLAEKLERAAFSTTGSDFTVAALRSHGSAAAAQRIHRVVMGVDGETWRRSTPVPERGPVVAVGRLVPKKGFPVLVEAVSLLADDPAFEGLVIVGAGPELEALREDAERLGVTDRITFAGALAPSAVREVLERAVVVAVPCVIAPDGDADSMPVIAKEALAMEIPVVASDAAGLPEVVSDACGRLVPAGDASATAEALREVLDMSPDERRALGARGRERVVGELGSRTQTAVLVDLIRAARADR